jgi:hypothetical protein
MDARNEKWACQNEAGGLSGELRGVVFGPASVRPHGACWSGIHASKMVTEDNVGMGSSNAMCDKLAAEFAVMGGWG